MLWKLLLSPERCSSPASRLLGIIVARAARRRVHLDYPIELVVVYYGLRIAPKSMRRHNRLETVAPFNFAGQIGGPNLNRLSRRLDSALEHCDEFEFEIGQLL